MDIYSKLGITQNPKKYNFPEDYSYLVQGGAKALGMNYPSVAGDEIVHKLTEEQQAKAVSLAGSEVRYNQLVALFSESNVMGYLVSGAPLDAWDSEHFMAEIYEYHYVTSLLYMQRYSFWHELRLICDDFSSRLEFRAGWRVVRNG